MKKLIPYAKLMSMSKKDKLLKAIIDDRIQDVAKGRTCKWTRVSTSRWDHTINGFVFKGFVISKK